MMHLCGEVDTEDMEGTADMEDMEVYTEQQMHLCWRHWILTFLETRSTHCNATDDASMYIYVERLIRGWILTFLETRSTNGMQH